MLTIRLTRKGKKNQPFFRVVVIDKRRSSKGGRAVEDLGYVDPLKKRKSFKKERILYWISKGAKPSSTIHNLLVSEKIIEGKKINLSKKSKRIEETPSTPAAATLEVKPAESAPASAVVEIPAPVETPKDLPAQAEELKPAETPQTPETPKA
jgi:small subunit ribosomal protein S16